MSRYEPGLFRRYGRGPWLKPTRTRTYVRFSFAPPEGHNLVFGFVYQLLWRRRSARLARCAVAQSLRGMAPANRRGHRGVDRAAPMMFSNRLPRTKLRLEDRARANRSGTATRSLPTWPGDRSTVGLATAPTKHGPNRHRPPGLTHDQHARPHRRAPPRRNGQQPSLRAARPADLVVRSRGAEDDGQNDVAVAMLSHTGRLPQSRQTIKAMMAIRDSPLGRTKPGAGSNAQSRTPQESCCRRNCFTPPGPVRLLRHDHAA